MKLSRAPIATACAVLATMLAAVAQAQAPAPKGDAVSASVEIKATVVNVDPKTREFTLKGEDGQEHTFVASDEVRNLGQVKKGDIVRVTYTEELAYEVKKGGATTQGGAAIVGERAKEGMKPAGTLARQIVVNVQVTAIDPKVPSITFKGPKGNTRTIKVEHPEKLEGIKVGDTVEITYTEALAVKVEEAPKK